MKRLRIALSILLGLVVLLGIATWLGLQPLPNRLTPDSDDIRRVQVRDRHGIPLSVTYENDWNLQDIVPLEAIPPLLRQAFIMAEDQRFYTHSGIDWRARFVALGQDLAAMRAVRGASTISEQAVRMLHPRPRTVWSRWLEGWEAQSLERRFSKEQILEFYLNQVPYSRRRRGVVQAARSWFDRDLSTLSPTEMLSLAVIVRAPARLNPKEGETHLRKRVALLAERMAKADMLAGLAPTAVAEAPLELHAPSLPVAAGHFVRFLRTDATAIANARGGRLDTTLDASLQARVQTILDTRLHDLQNRDVGDGAVLVLDHQSGEILAWVNGAGDDPELEGSMIDVILTPRQPGSTLKPFLYAAALDRGWTAATVIDDAPIAGQVGAGQHAFRNYSRHFYGPLRLRECLGNSLNTPAVRTIEKIGQPTFLDLLHRLGFASLDRPADIYGLGLALGNGEVTLLELAQAYATLANAGVFRPAISVFGDAPPETHQRIFSVESASLIGNILSDPEARRLESAVADGRQDRHVDGLLRRLGCRLQPPLRGRRMDGEPEPHTDARRDRSRRSGAGAALGLCRTVPIRGGSAALSQSEAGSVENLSPQRGPGGSALPQHAGVVRPRGASRALHRTWRKHPGRRGEKTPQGLRPRATDSRLDDCLRPAYSR